MAVAAVAQAPSPSKLEASEREEFLRARGAVQSALLSLVQEEASFKASKTAWENRTAEFHQKLDKMRKAHAAPAYCSPDDNGNWSCAGSSLKKEKP